MVGLSYKNNFSGRGKIKKRRKADKVYGDGHLTSEWLRTKHSLRVSQSQKNDFGYKKMTSKKKQKEPPETDMSFLQHQAEERERLGLVGSETFRGKDANEHKSGQFEDSRKLRPTFWGEFQKMEQT